MAAIGSPAQQNLTGPSQLTHVVFHRDRQTSVTRRAEILFLVEHGGLGAVSSLVPLSLFVRKSTVSNTRL